MKIEKEYVAEIVGLLKDAPANERDVEYLKENGIDVQSDRFFAHYKYMLQNRIIETETGSPGYSQSHNGDVTFSAIPLKICQ